MLMERFSEDEDEDVPLTVRARRRMAKAIASDHLKPRRRQPPNTQSTQPGWEKEQYDCWHTMYGLRV